MSWTTCLSAQAPEVHLAKGYLEHRGVPCLLLNNGPTIYPMTPFGMQLLVPEEWLPVAQKMLTGPRRRPLRAARSHLRRVS